ncbi:MAG: hypothetical protein AB7P40_22035, partial [Chloroflexota bacterium]
LLMLAVGIRAPIGYAQDGPNNREATVTITENGNYAVVAGPILTAAFDRAMQELEGFSPQITPDQAREASFRRRLLELRLLMDLYAYAYDSDRLSTFRDLVDDAYERTGNYQDIPVVSKLLGASFPPDLVTGRQLNMNIQLAALRDPSIRSATRAFLGSPTGSIGQLEPDDVPRIWEIAGQTPHNGVDSVGNAAMLGASALAGVQASNPFVADVFDPVQEAHFHDVRKTIRSALLLMMMFPETRQAIQANEISEPMFELVSQYGDVNDAFVAHRIAPRLGADAGKAAQDLRDEFEKAQKRQGVVVEQRTFDALINALNAVAQRHQQ